MITRKFKKIQVYIPARNLLLNNVKSTQDIFTKVNINYNLQECDFLQENLKIFIFI